MIAISGSNVSVPLVLEKKDWFTEYEDSVNVQSKNNYYAGEIFQATKNYSLYYVMLKMCRDAVNPPGIVTVNLLESLAPPDKPFLPVIATGSTDGDTLTTDTACEWRKVNLSPHISMVLGNYYYIGVLQATGVYAALGLRCEGEEPEHYPNGMFARNGFPEWYVTENVDMLFEAWGF